MKEVSKNMKEFLWYNKFSTTYAAAANKSTAVDGIIRANNYKKYYLAQKRYACFISLDANVSFIVMSVEKIAICHFLLSTISQIEFACITSLIREKDKLFHVTQAKR